jgi:aryl-alcohol dehydrogenase-like predicted oxidoreductase
MNYRRHGRAGLQLSELAFGAFITFGEQVGDEVACSLAQLAIGWSMQNPNVSARTRPIRIGHQGAEENSHASDSRAGI